MAIGLLPLNKGEVCIDKHPSPLFSGIILWWSQRAVWGWKAYAPEATLPFGACQRPGPHTTPFTGALWLMLPHFFIPPNSCQDIHPPTHSPTSQPSNSPTHPPTHPPTHQPTHLPTHPAGQPANNLQVRLGVVIYHSLLPCSCCQKPLQSSHIFFPSPLPSLHITTHPATQPTTHLS